MPATHPTGRDLDDFLIGKLPDPFHARVEEHLSGCTDCQARAATIRPRDTLVELIASADAKAAAVRAASVTPPPDRTAVAATVDWDGEAGDFSVTLPPAGLVDHPRYTLIRPLGEGGMGRVWLAEHVVMGRPVALKVIRPEFLARPGSVERFRREVRAAAQLNHPNLATAFDAEEAGGTHYLVMEYVPGETLAQLVKARPLPVAEACRAVRDAARGLAHAHAAGFVHRDIKPGNLIRTPDSTTKVLDFGLVGADDRAAGLTAENVVMGTPDYIAPEQADAAHAADARADVYSLGCTLYHLLAGRVPYPAPTVLGKLDAHRDPTRSPEPLTGVPPALAAVVEKMMAKRPTDRPATAADVAAALDPWAGGETLTTPNRPGAYARPAPARRWAVALGILVATATAAAGVVYKIQRDNEVIVVEADDPDIEVQMRRNGDLVRIVDTKAKQTWELDAKRLRLKPDGSELTIDVPDAAPLKLRRDGAAAVTIRREGKAVPAAAGTAPVVNLNQQVPQLRLVRKHDWPERHAYVSRFSPDGRYYAATGDAGGGTARVWESATGREVATVPGCGWLAFGPDGRTLFSYGHHAGGRAIRGWNLKTGEPVAAIEEPTQNTHSGVLAAGGTWLASGHSDRTVRLWNVETRERRKFAFDTMHVPFAVAAGDKAVVVYDYNQQDTTIRLIDVESGNILRWWTSPDRSLVLNARAARDGKSFVTCHPGGVRLWRLDRDEPVQLLSIPQGHGASAVSPDLNYVLWATPNDPDVRLIHVPSAKVVGTHRLDRGGIDTHDFSPDGEYAVITCSGPSVVYLLALPPEVRAAGRKP
jgi:WD40 repeat protein/tRNA A-37 threonylcarbamoyl transferase component Bud32